MLRWAKYSSLPPRVSEIMPTPSVTAKLTACEHDRVGFALVFFLEGSDRSDEHDGLASALVQESVKSADARPYPSSLTLGART